MQNTETDKITLMQALRYEIAGSSFASFISWPWLQNIVGSYYARKTERKYRRYLMSVETKKQLSKIIN